MNTPLVFVGVVVVLVAILSYSSSEERLDSPQLMSFYLTFKNSFFNVFGRNSFQTRLKKAVARNLVQPRVDDSIPFPCNTTNTRSPTRPESVHKLRPGDIDVIAAMGDSITAGNGAFGTNILEVILENRGVSGSAGGQGTWREFLTLPNIIKEFNPNLIGYSYGDSAGSFVREAQFNVAVAGAISEDMPYMAKILVKRIRADKRVNFEKDWKMITLLIGSNDFCAHICFKTPSEFERSAEAHRQDLTAALDYLRDNLPRTIVNILLTPNLKFLHKLKGRPPQCFTLVLFGCPCLFGMRSRRNYPKMLEKMSEWQQVEKEVTSDKRYQSKKDFAVVLQPFSAGITVPDMPGNSKISDYSYLSADCFHLSQKGHAQMGNGLWNNIMEPVHKKSEFSVEAFTSPRFLCPTEEHPYIYTYGNS